MASIQSLVFSSILSEKSNKNYPGILYKILNYSDKLWRRGIESENLKDFYCYLQDAGSPDQCPDNIKTWTLT